MAETSKAAPRRRMMDLRKQPGFDQIAWICMFFLYAPILIMVLC